MIKIMSKIKMNNKIFEFEYKMSNTFIESYGNEIYIIPHNSISIEMIRLKESLYIMKYSEYPRQNRFFTMNEEKYLIFRVDDQNYWYVPEQDIDSKIKINDQYYTIYLKTVNELIKYLTNKYEKKQILSVIIKFNINVWMDTYKFIIDHICIKNHTILENIHQKSILDNFTDLLIII